MKITYISEPGVAIVDQFTPLYDMPKLTVTLDQEVIGITTLLNLTGLTSSMSESSRMIAQGAVQLDGKTISDRTIKLTK
ncbi:MAG: hypothetical protein GY829_13230, partial [Gammaproteobacteria bacterium]|nr:hypothetical protein [Gammaproteobacteria bacterium]